MPQGATFSLPRERDVEAIVVGGGPAGSTVATALAGAGHRVLLLDKAQFPRHKACSEYINPAGARLLDELGMSHELRRAGAHRMEAMVVCAPDGHRFTVNFAQAEPGRTALGISRYRFDHLLLERAKAAGVVVYERARVREIMRENEHVVGVVATIGGTRECLRASLVIGADGHHSAVARELGLDISLRWPRKTGLVAHYRGVAELDTFGEMHVGHQAYVGLAPLEDGLTNVAVVTNVRAVEAREGSIEEFFCGALRSIPAVARRLDGAEPIGGIRGVGRMARRARRITGDGYLLVGDAASFLDPFIGDGIYEALRGAQLAAPVASRALKAGDTTADALDPYRIECRRAFTAKRQVCWIVQGFISAPPLMNYVTERLSRREELGVRLSGVIGNLRPAADALSPIFLARLLRP